MIEVKLSELIGKKIAVQELKIRHQSWGPEAYFFVRGNNDKGAWGTYANGVPAAMIYDNLPAAIDDANWEVWKEPPPALKEWKGSTETKPSAGLYVARRDFEMEFGVDGCPVEKIGVPEGSVFFLREANPKFWKPLLSPYPSHDGMQWERMKADVEK